MEFLRLQIRSSLHRSGYTTLSSIEIQFNWQYTKTNSCFFHSIGAAKIDMASGETRFKTETPVEKLINYAYKRLWLQNQQFTSHSYLEHVLHFDMSINAVRRLFFHNMPLHPKWKKKVMQSMVIAHALSIWNFFRSVDHAQKPNSLPFALLMCKKNMTNCWLKPIKLTWLVVAVTAFVAAYDVICQM